VSTWIRESIPRLFPQSSKSSKYDVKFIADYSPRRKLSFAEVEQAIRNETGQVDEFNCVPVRPFNTVEAGFALRQLACESPYPDNTLFYVNVAPRRDDTSARSNNEGEDLVFLELENGVPVVSTCSGYTLSFVKDKIAEARSLDIPSYGSQFRSRDIFPKAVADLIDRKEEFLEDKVNLDIPEPPEEAIGYIDGFGNIKTTIRQSEVDFNNGDQLNLELDGENYSLAFSDGIFHVDEGELVFAPGSSGGDNPFMEVVLRGGSAEEKLGEPDPGDDLKIS